MLWPGVFPLRMSSLSRLAREMIGTMAVQCTLFRYGRAPSAAGEFMVRNGIDSRGRSPTVWRMLKASPSAWCVSARGANQHMPL